MNGYRGLISTKFYVRHVLEAIYEPPWFRLLPPSKPLTWRERVARRLADYRERVVTAWRVLRGDDIHEERQ